MGTETLYELAVKVTSELKNKLKVRTERTDHLDSGSNIQQQNSLDEIHLDVVRELI